MDARPGAWRCETTPGRGTRFTLTAGDALVPAFVIDHGGVPHAFVNRCPHAGRPLDREPEQFWSDDGLHLVCGAHGAIFDPATGVCVEGPCPGARLEPLRVERDGDHLVISWPS